MRIKIFNLIKKIFKIFRNKNKVVAFLETIEPSKLSGWVVDKSFKINEVRLIVGNKVICSTFLNIFRPDVCQKFGIKGSFGFELILPSEFLPTNIPPELIAISSDGNKRATFNFSRNPKQLPHIIKSLLNSDLLGCHGHFDGIRGDGNLHGWATKLGTNKPLIIWMQIKNTLPEPIMCDIPRDDLSEIGIPEVSGFTINPKSLPDQWAGKEISMSFDKEGKFLLTQDSNIFLPNLIKNVDASITDLEQINNSSYETQIENCPTELIDKWQSLSETKQFLDKVEIEISRAEVIKARNDSKLLNKFKKMFFLKN